MTFSGNRKSLKHEDPYAVKTVKNGLIFASFVLAVAIWIIGLPVLTAQPEPATAVERNPSCPVIYIYPSDGSERKVVVPEQSNCTEENAGKVTEVRMSNTDRPTVTHYVR